MIRIILRLAVVVALVGLISSAAALSGRGDRSSRKPPTVKAGSASSVEVVPGFEMRSRLMAADPRVAADLELVRSQPNDPLSWRALGTTLAELGAFVDATAALERAIELDADSADAWVDLGAAHVRAGESGDGIKAFKRALKLEPFHARARYNLGVAYEELDLYDEALDQYELALAIDSSLGDPKFNPAAANNMLLPYVKLRVYMRTVGGTPAMFTLPGE